MKQEPSRYPQALRDAVLEFSEILQAADGEHDVAITEAIDRLAPKHPLFRDTAEGIIYLRFHNRPVS